MEASYGTHASGVLNGTHASGVLNKRTSACGKRHAHLARDSRASAHLGLVSRQHASGVRTYCLNISGVATFVVLVIPGGEPSPVVSFTFCITQSRAFSITPAERPCA